MFRRNTSDLGDNIFNLRHVDALDAFFDRLQALIGTRLVNHVDGLVGHMTVIDVARGELSGGAQGFITVFDAVMLLESAFQAAQNSDGVFNRRLGHIDFLEATCQGTVLLENPAKLLERR
ncbi:hypothetical protein ALP75_203392 [Pseudomonas syringae pv. actinidiae]|nr:hypothetical protein ALP75_203392 [Pseudomonas syringae pv. actinidiae]